MIIPVYYGNTKQLFNSTPIVDKLCQSHRADIDINETGNASNGFNLVYRK